MDSKYESNILGTLHVVGGELGDYFGCVLVSPKVEIGKTSVKLECMSMEEDPLNLIRWAEEKIPTVESMLPELMEPLYEWVQNFYKTTNLGFEFDASFEDVCRAWKMDSILLFESGGYPPISISGNLGEGFTMDTLPVLSGQDIIFHFDASVNLLDIGSDG